MQSKSVWTHRHHIFFNGGVTRSNMTSLHQLLYQHIHGSKSVNSNPIYLFINTPGGLIDQTISIIDLIQSSSRPIYTVANGYVASAGTILLVVGHKRFITPNSRIMIHQLSIGVEGDHTYRQIQDLYHNARTSMDYMTRTYLENTHGKLSRRTLERWYQQDREIDAKVALKYGLVDEYFRLDQAL